VNSFPTNTISQYSLIEYQNYDYLKEMAQWALETSDEQNHRTNVKAKMSHWKIWSKTDLFNKFLTNIGEEVISLPWTADEFGSFIYTSAWTSVYTKGDYTKIHNHSPSYISIIASLDDGEYPHPVIFSDSNTEIEMITGRVLIFPGYIRHHVPVYHGDKPRIIFAGNLGVENE